MFTRGLPTSHCTVQVEHDGGDGNEVFIHTLREGHLGFEVMFQGLEYTVSCLSSVQSQYNRYMLPRKLQDVSKLVLSPMPGRVIACHLAPGKEVCSTNLALFFAVSHQRSGQVHEGDSIFVLEAMKMQVIIKSPKDAVVKNLNAKEGDSVDADAVLVEWEK